MTLPNLAGALRRCRDQPEIIALDGGPGGWAYLALPTRAQAIVGLGDVPEPDAGAAELAGTGWPAAIDGGWWLQLDYDCPVGPNAAPPAAAGPLGWAAPCDAWVAWAPDGEACIAGPDAAARQRLAVVLAQPDPGPSAAPVAARPQPAWSADTHMRRVRSVVQRIAAGDCFQANLTVPFSARIDQENGGDLGLFLALRAASPAAYASFWRQNGRSIVCHSPECFLQGSGEGLRSDPIKGTRRRHPGYEAATRSELLASAKDRAELAMIVDLVRNDLGRIALPGSVRVAEAARIMDLDYVHHLVARVESRPRPNTGVRDWLAAAFPAGSITGAPKIEAMGLLTRLEGGPRGPYCGSMGWIGHRACALSVAIRCMTVSAGMVHFAAGGGIVADSDPAAEWAEVEAKASRMRAALE